MEIKKEYQKYFDTFSANYRRKDETYCYELLKKQIHMELTAMTKAHIKLLQKRKVIELLTFNEKEGIHLLEGYGNIPEKEYQELQTFLSNCEKSLDEYLSDVSELQLYMENLQTDSIHNKKDIYTILQVLLVLTDKSYQKIMVPKLNIVEMLPQVPETMIENKEEEKNALALRQFVNVKLIKLKPLKDCWGPKTK